MTLFSLIRWLTKDYNVVIANNMKARLIEKSRTVINENAFFEVVLWQLPKPLNGSNHLYKYRLALVVKGECVLRYDNERGKGDHKHVYDQEIRIEFSSLEVLFDDFQNDMRRVLQ